MVRNNQMGGIKKVKRALTKSNVGCNKHFKINRYIFCQNFAIQIPLLTLLLDMGKNVNKKKQKKLYR